MTLELNLQTNFEKKIVTKYYQEQRAELDREERERASRHANTFLFMF